LPVSCVATVLYGSSTYCWVPVPWLVLVVLAYIYGFHELVVRFCFGVNFSVLVLLLTYSLVFFFCCILAKFIESWKCPPCNFKAFTPSSWTLWSWCNRRYSSWFWKSTIMIQDFWSHSNIIWMLLSYLSFSFFCL
jgi:hypothetical protein